ncbi:DUF2975 domain-containing protein [Lysinibacillus sp. 2017]|uniref:DUF2975 domain-containing protein n=1 Tax=unclassified Lysinibacillus TaxID=2636778 RepID=UPI000D529ECA|nr:MULTISPECIES: DUF2975 domain-containing protein [unclassified Lysinibacillus]AWE08214.1 DUF2975 domain-containing protein [Lysinibacillus sp. 2017]TGN36283.1 DUF2975 domain-containing protein [Lysinibacillus sp. S2017]
MKRETLILKLAVIIIGLPIAGILAFLTYDLIAVPKTKEFILFVPMVIVLYVAAIPYFIALFQTIKLLGYIDRNNAFSVLSVQALKKIKLCAIVISVFFIVDLPFLFRIADVDDAPGIVLFSLIIIFASIVIAVFAAVLQKLLTNALAIKSENDLTI